ncbi:MAG: DUF2937 family protein [Opitutaceae bacterium]|nr:DUF2937 family protein [Opitutaceae bacterium]
MKPTSAIGRWFDRWADRIACVIGAVLAAQGPSFMLQYLQRLGGHLDEARRQLALLVSAAEKSGRPWREWAESAQANSDAAVAELGKVIIDSHARVEHLQQAHDSLAQASVFSRPIVFLRDLDTQVFSGTWSDYSPTVPTTVEGAVYAFVGMVLAWSLYSLLTEPARRLASRPAAA